MTGPAACLLATARRVALGVVAAGALLAGAGAVAAPASAAVSATAASVVAPVPARLAAAAIPQTVKYYVVAPPDNGRKEFLFEIAERLLRTGDRWVEIYKLNQGRPQPGGGMLTDPQFIQPGWVLVLPADASGPGVRVGVPPTAVAVPPPLAGTSDGAHPSARAAGAQGAAGGPVSTARLAGMLVVATLCLGLVVGLPLLSAAHRRPANSAPGQPRFGPVGQLAVGSAGVKIR